MKIKRIIYIFIVVAVMFSLAACGSTEGTGGDGNGDSSLPSHSPSPDAGAGQNGGSPSPVPGTDAGGGGIVLSPGPGSDSGGGGSAPSPNPSNEPGGNDPSPGAGPDAGADQGGGGGSGLPGTPEEILAKVIDGLNNAGVEMPMALPPTLVSADVSQNTAGLSEADFGKYVSAAAQSIAAIGTFAHQIIVFQGVDDSAALQIKKLVSGSGGYDPQKWICVFPEKVIAVEAGSYVLLVASYREVTDTAVEVFKEITGGIGDVATFWESAA